jgi:hypothetical protein
MSETIPPAGAPAPVATTTGVTLADALLQQGGPLDAELGRLREIVAAERRRAETLARWTKRVWFFLAVLVVMGIVSVVVYMNLSHQSPGYRPNASAESHWPKLWDVIGMLMAAFFFLAVLLGPVLFVIGLVLTFFTYFARRTAGMHEMRASLASLEAQVRVLAGERKA